MKLFALLFTLALAPAYSQVLGDHTRAQCTPGPAAPWLFDPATPTVYYDCTAQNVYTARSYGGQVVNTTCPPLNGTQYALLFDNGDSINCNDSLATVDVTGKVTAPGGIATGNSSVAGGWYAEQGPAPPFPVNSFGFYAPTSYTNSLFACPPNANPTANQMMIFPVPTLVSTGIYTVCWTWDYPISLTTTGSGAATYSGATKILNIPTPSVPTVVQSPGAYFTGGGSALTTSVAVIYKTVEYGCTVAANSLPAFVINIDTGTASFDVWKIATGGTALPTVTQTILTGGYLAISSGTHLSSTSTALLTTTTITAGDTFGFKLQTVSGSPTQASIQLVCQ